jgi:hypothetical protein
MGHAEVGEMVRCDARHEEVVKRLGDHQGPAVFSRTNRSSDGPCPRAPSSKKQDERAGPPWKTPRGVAVGSVWEPYAILTWLAQRTSVGSTEASKTVPARFGVVGPTRATLRTSGASAESLDTRPAVRSGCGPRSEGATVKELAG